MSRLVKRLLRNLLPRVAALMYGVSALLPPFSLHTLLQCSTFLLANKAAPLFTGSYRIALSQPLHCAFDGASRQEKALVQLHDLTS